MKKDYTNQTLTTGSFAVSCLLLIFKILSGQIKDLFHLYFCNRKNKLIHYVSSILILLLLSLLSNTVNAQVSGKVFKDFNANATQETTAVFTEPGIAGVIVTAYNAAGVAVGTATTATDGSYSIAGASGSLRIEFTNFPEGIYEGPAGTGNKTSVQFVTAPTTTATLGINCPEDYCNTANPKLVTVCYDNGSGVGNTNPVVVGINYTATGSGTNTYPTSGTADNMGSIWGVAYDKKTKLSYFSAFLKRQAGLGDRGLDGIYVVNYSTATPSLVGGFDLEGVVPSNGGSAISFGSVTRNLIASGSGTGVNDLSADRTQASRDADAYAKVGKVGYGDIDIDQLRNTLWAVNLNERSLVAVDISSNVHNATIPTTLASGKVKRFFINGTTAPFISGIGTCPNGTMRPFGLKIYKDKGYLGTVCDGAGLSTVDMSVNQKAYVYSFDLANPTTFTEVTSVPLNYNREQSWVPFTPAPTFDALESDNWQRWIDTYTDPTTFGDAVNSTNADFKTGINGIFVGAPQPILSDIEFLPNGDMVLGFMDRFAHQQGWANYIPTSSSVLRNAVSHGDMLLASKTTTGFVFEGPNENDNFTTPAVSAAAQSGQELNDGPAGGGEFFYKDYYIGSDATHPETALGGLAVLPGSNEITAISFDPAAFNSMGVRWLNYNTGNETRNYTIVANTGVSNFGKGSALGDVELLCNLAPIEIGNRVWKDTDKDGIQDPGEPALVGVTLVLYNNSNVPVDTTVTDATGNYIFSSLTDPDVKSNTSYRIKVVSLGTNASVTGLLLTDVTNAPGELGGQNTGTTLANNDAFLSSNIPTILFTTGTAGENNHTLDFGFVSCTKPSLTFTVKKATCTNGTINNDGLLTVTPIGADKVGISYGGTSYAGPNYANASTDFSLELPNIIIDSTKIWIRVFAGLNNAACIKDTSFILAPTPCVTPKPCNAAPGEIGGNIFRDFNNTGTKDSLEIGLAGVEVKVFDCLGVLLGTTTTDKFGNYSFAGMPSAQVRVEFGTLPLPFVASKVGVDNGSTTQFVTAPDCTVDLGVNDPTDYCQNDPLLVTTCFVNGDPLLGGTTGISDYMVAWNYYPAATQGVSTHVAEGNIIGTTWGIAYDRIDKKLFTSAFLKRHAGLGIGGSGAIYAVDMKDTANITTSLFVDLKADLGINVGVDPRITSGQPLPANKNVANHDSLAFNLIGKMSLGDIDISEDQKTLWVTNLNDRTLIELPIGSPATKPVSFKVHNLPNPGCANGVFRVFATKTYKGDVYVGGVCTAENGGTAADLKAIVYKHNALGATSSFTEVLNFPLNYPRGYVSYNGGANPPQFVNAEWNPWISKIDDIPVANQHAVYNQVMHPQPMLSDIEMDVNGDMILSFSDRIGHQFGNLNWGTSKADTVNGYEATAAGDILRASFNGTTYTIENNATSGNITTVGANQMVPAGGQGPGGGEYYWQDIYSLSSNPNSTGGHQEISNGSLVLFPGTNEIVSTVYDPINEYRAAGVRYYNNTTGEMSRAYQIFGQDGAVANNRLETFAKGANLGDLEALCNLEPIEIGNRLWLDLDNDGVQDPCETPIANVSVSLYDKLGNLIAQTTTDANGNYYFNETNVVDTLGLAKPNFLGPQPLTDYFVVVGKEDSSFDKTKSMLSSGSAKLNLTVANSTQSNGNDQNDSDGQTSGVVGIPSALNGYPVIAVKTPLSGSDHTLDFGFTCKPVITATPKKQTVCGTGTASAFTRKVVSGYVSSQQWYGPLTDTASAFTTKIAGAVDSTFTPSTLPAAGQTRYYAVIARNGDSLCADTAFVALTVSSKIILQATPTNALCSTGGGSIATTVSGGTSPYTYLWSNGATTSSITNVSSGSYTITVTDAGGCTKDTTLVLTQPDSLSLSLSTMSVTCNAGTDGGLTSMLSGGKAPYSYEWYNGSVATGLYFSNNPAVTGLAAGVYTLKVIDANGCFKTKTVTVTQPIKINVAQSQKDNICFDQSKGEVYVKIGGGTPPVTIKWNVDGVYKPAYDGLDTLRNLKAGIYELVLTDVNGCTTTVKDTLTQPDSLHIAFTKVDGLCSTGNKGSVNTTVTGGVAPYSYSWSNTAATANVANLVSGNYKLVVTDAKGCKDSITVFIDEEDCRVDVALKKTVDGVCERKVGDWVTFKVVVSRQDTTSQSTTVIIKDQISSDFLITSSTPTKGSFDVSTGLWSGIILTKGDSATLTVVAKIKVGSAGLLCNQAHVDFMDKLDIDSQAGNVNPIEDDIAYACVTVPIDLCQADGHSVTLTTPDSLTSIKWFKDGVELTAEAGKTSITVSGAGSYTYTGTTNGTSCPVGNCCPVIIKDACYGSIGDYVWNDNNINGKQDGGETPVAGVKVYLLDGTTGAKLDSAITDINGKYLFDSLLTGTYKVQFVEPVGKDFTILNTGGDTTKDSDAGTNGMSGSVSIDTTKPSTDLLRNNLTIDAGIIPQFGSIGDYVWTDQNNDGQQTAGENPIAGVKVYLYDNIGLSLVLLDSAVTDVNGKYLFDSLLSGSYIVQFVAPTGTIPAKQNTGADVTDSDANKLGFSQNIIIDTTKPTSDTLRNNPQIDAGFVPVGSLGDYVFADKNGNGTQEATDTPIAGIKVYLTDNAGVKLDSTVTDATGKYLFDSLLAGTYKVQFVIPSGSEATTKTAGGDITKDSNINPDGTTDAVTIDTTLPLGNVGRDNPTVDAGIVPAYGSIGDYVWTDQNNDGQQSAGENPIAGVKVYLYDAAGTTKLDSTVTDATGKYLFDSLLTGGYKVQFVAPTGTIASKQNTGADVTDSDANKLGFSQVINIDTTKPTTDTLRNNPQIDAGFVPVGSLGDYVFTDKNGNGTQEATDTPIAGIKVYLTDNAGVKLDSTVTDATGKYLFDSLLAGTYKVKFEIPAGSEATTKTAGGDITKDSNINPDGTTDAVTIDTTLPLGNVGRDNPTIDAGIVPAYGSIGDYVWTDQNNDGQQSAGENPIAGVKVYLYDATGTTKLDSTVTDATGKYLFDSLLTGGYKVQFVAPTGTIASKQNTGADVTDSDANKLGFSQNIIIDTTKPTTDTLRNNPQIDAGFVPVGSLGDYVFADKNGNGTQEATDTPIVGIKVYLTDNAGVKLDSTLTDATGKYLFDSLLAGTYKVKFEIPAGSEATAKTAGVDTAKDSNINPDGTTDAVVIDTTLPLGNVGRDNPTIDAGIVPAYGSIGDYVWTDQNNDGQQTAGELPIAGVKVYLYDATGTTKLDSTVTDATGKYLFDSLLTGGYKVQFVAPTGTIPSKQNTGADVSDSDANKLGFSQMVNINTALLATDTLRNNPQIDAGFVPVGSLGDYVFADKNGNGTQEATDTPIAGIKVYLTDNTGVKLDSTVTDATGKYLFDSLLAGTYKVQFVIPSGSEATTKTAGGDITKDSNINPDGTTDAVVIDTTLPLGNVGRDNPTIDAGIVPAYGSIGDYVWTDQNNDGQQSAGENPIAGVKVYLYDSTGTTKLDSTVTDATGKYLFDSLLTGGYKVQFVAPTGTIPSKQNTGADVTDSDANKLGFSQVININTALLASDTLRNNPQIDAGFVPVGSLGDYVFTDKNGNGTQEATDTPIAGIKVYLTDNAGVKLDSTLTDATGKYLFDSLLAGTYKVQFVIPSGSEATAKTAGADTAKDSNINPDGTTDAVTIDTTLPLGNVGRDNTTVDAGIVPAYGSIGDYVWTDQNNDGQQTAGENPIAGVKVYLYDATGTTKLDSTVTDATGKYLFDSLLTGGYKVQFVAPTGTIASKQNTGADVTDSDANKLGWSQVINIDTTKPTTDTLRNNPQIDAGFVPVGSLGDYVFADKNGNGTQEATDTPLAGIKVYLTDNAGVKLDSTVTDANGKYLFDSLLAGTYKVKFVIPAGSEATAKTAGGDTAKDSNINPDGTTDAVTIDTTLPLGNVGRDNTTVDAGIVPAYGSIGDYVWTDQNNDGQQSAGELPIAGVKVYLYDATGTTKLDSTVTDATGKYLFDSLLTGGYKVQFVAPTGTIPAKQNTGADVTDSDVNKLGFSQVINIDTTKPTTDTLRNNPQIDAGFVPVGSLGDYVFTDKNGNGTQEATDTPIAGIKVYLTDNAGVKLDSTVTDANGKYLFDSLLAGTYKVQFVIPSGSEATTKTAGGDITKDSNINPDGTTDAVTIDTTLPLGNVGRDNPTVDAGIVPAYGSIGDYVWTDQNNDGQQTAGELPIAGVKVYLYDATGTTKLDSTVTDANGKYLFDSLLTGGYKVQFVAPTGTIPSKQNTGADVIDSDANKLGFSQVVNINTALLATDTLRNNPQIDAGFVPVGSLGDYVFADKNGNGTQEATDTPIAGIKVYLTDNAGVKLDSTVTDATGKYLFDSLLAGTYKVKFVIPSGSEVTTKTAGGDITKDSNINPDGITDAVTIDTTLPLGNVGRDNPTVDAGIVPAYGSIGDYVWTDQNNDGQQTAGELPIAGVKVYLYDATGTVKLDSTVTDATGKYLFDSLLTGGYKVQFVAPTGTIPSKQNTGADVTDSDANKLGFSQVVNINTALLATDTLRNNPQIDAGFVPVGSIGDYVFNDKDNSNTQTAGDTPVAGVKVYLLNGAGVKIDSTVTDASGKYLFDSLVAGTYSVQFVKPTGMNFVTPTQGGDPTKDSDANATTGTSSPVVIDTTQPLGNVGRDNTTVDAGLKGIPQFGSIGDYVWTDQNNDGQQSAGELPIAGVKVYLYDATGTTKLDSTVTDANGKYLFDSLLTGGYKVQFVAPTGTIPAKQNTGADVTDSDANKLGFSQVVNINTALLATDTLRNNPQIDAGFVPVGSIGDYVFNDKDNSNTQTAGDTPVAGVKVYLLNGTGVKIDSTVTDANGKYLFDSLVAGTYSVQFVKPVGVDFVTQNVGVESTDSDVNTTTGKSDPVVIDTTKPIGDPARNNRDVDAGVKPQYGSIGDFVWTDVNNDGIQVPSELPISGVKVYLYNGAGTVKLDSATTDANGKYLFDSLLTGSYKVKFVAPEGTVPAKQNIGNDLMDSDANKLGWSQVVNINTALLPSDTLRNNPNVDAGFVPVGSLGDYVWFDVNKDGLQANGEPAVKGVKVYLLDGVSGTKLDSTVTDALGKYLFDSLLSGSYKVQFVAPKDTNFTVKGTTNSGLDSNPNASTGLTDAVTIDTSFPLGNASRDNRSVDAGLTINLGSIAGKTFDDNDKSGTQNTGDVDRSGVKVYLYKETTQGVYVKVDSVVTDSQGNYKFNNLTSANYQVQFNKPTGTTYTIPNIGDDTKDSDANPADGRTGIININTNLPETDLGRNSKYNDAGFTPIPDNCKDEICVPFEIKKVRK